MEKKKFLLLNFFDEFRDKDSYFEELTNEEGTFARITSQCLLLIIFSFLYGVVMGSYNSFQQAISSGLKLPVLFLLALFICFPALFIIQYALGSRLKFWQMLKIMLSGFVLISLIMASFAPIVIFFLITGDNYAFLKLLHVGIIGLSGIFGMKTIIDALRFSCEKKNIYPKVGVVVFRFWILILAFVGTQLAWNLRPFVGSKVLPFELFRKREGNFYIAVIQTSRNLVFPKEGQKDNKAAEHSDVQHKPN